MDVLELAEEIGLLPKKAASTNGGEFKSACPNCKDGKDRFCIWPNQGKTGYYWCRVCEKKGDAIQFCRDFLGMTFHQACQKISVSPSFKTRLSEAKYPIFQTTLSYPYSSWQQVAKKFIDFAHQKLMHEPQAIEYLEERGFSIETIKNFHLGWNPDNLFDQRARWGLPTEIKENGLPKRQWLPKGIVIPTFSKNEPIKIKIRRSDWHLNDSFPKYVEIPGSHRSPSIYGNISTPIIIVESELDAILIQQHAAHLICCIALGGVSKKPDSILHKLILNSRLVLISLDHDEPGKNKYTFWIKNYQNLKPWPPPRAKSIGDSIQFYYLNVVEWIKSAFSNN